MDVFVTGPWHHFIVVERVDFKLFQPLSGPSRTVMIIEDILPKWIHHLWQAPFFRRRSLWWSWKTGFMVGWHIQQLVKLQMAFIVEQQGLILCDSDMFFLRPFDVAKLHGREGYRFYRTTDAMDEKTISNPSYTMASFRQLGLPPDSFPARTYVDNLVTWKASTVRNMCAHLEKISGRDWRAALGRNIIFSEYTLYGLYVERLAKELDLSPTSDHLCQTKWTKDSEMPVNVESFIAALSPGVVAVAFQSFLNVDHDLLRNIFDRAVRSQAAPSSPVN